MKLKGNSLPIFIIELIICLSLIACEDEKKLSLASLELLDEIESQLKAAVETDSAGGITYGVIHGDRVVHYRTFGWSDRERKKVTHHNDIYRTGSISKSMTAVVMMILLEEGVLNLYDPVENYFPEIKKLKDYSVHQPITLYHLATHTSGLIREPELKDAATGPIEQWQQKIIDSIPKTRFKFPPGEGWSYSNIGYGILGLTLSRAANEDFMEIMEKFLFNPLGMKSSTFIISDRLKPRLASGYMKDGDVYSNTLPSLEHIGRGYKVPNGGVYSTMNDLAKFMGAMSVYGENQVLTQKGRSRMIKTHIKTSSVDAKTRMKDLSNRGFGIGFFTSGDDHPVGLVYHSGSVAGYKAHIVFHPQSGWGICVLLNYEMGTTDFINLGNATLRQIVEIESKTF